MGFELTCHRLANAVPIAPARPDRAIFDANRHAYRCLPLAVANAAGWEMLCPHGFTVHWNGGPAVSDLIVDHDDGAAYPFAKSHFATGIVTFETGWVLRTAPGDHLWAMGPPNDPKDGVAPLSGLIETDWLPYTFTMNWKMTRPGWVRFEKGEPFCFLTPSRIADVADCQPVEKPMGGDLQAALQSWTAERDAFMVLFRAGDPEALKHPWGRRYFKGDEAPERHFHKLRAKPLVAPDTSVRHEPSEATRVIRCAADAEGLDFLVVDDALDADTCDRLAEIYRASADLYETGAKDPFWNDRVLRNRHIEEPLRALMLKAAEEGVRRISEFYKVDRPLYPDIVDLVGWPEGIAQPPHADNANEDGQPHEFEHRAYSAIVYLNDDFEGGELYLPKQDIAIRPRRGMLVSLPAGLSHLHSVRPITRGLRLTMASFLTFDRAHAHHALLPAT